MIRLRRTALTLGLLFGLHAAPAAAECHITPAPCSLDAGQYHMRLPDGPVKGALVYVHGYGGTGAGALRPKDWVDTALARGYAVIAPDGIPIAKGRPTGWGFIPGFERQRDDIDFLQAVRDDAAERLNIEVSQMVLTGFSLGGSMASYLACAAPDAFGAYAPVAGGFWRPHPTTCSGPVRLLHTHGWTDTTVPLEGRVLRGEDANDPAALMQGDIHYTMRVWRETNGCTQLRADRFVTDGPFLRRAWDRCDEDTALEFAIFPGGHVVPKGWGEMVINWFESLERE